MKLKCNSLLVGAALASVITFTGQAAKIGDPASPLAIKEWIKGKAVDVKDGKNVYVVEFWATWCGPCRTTIPHLTDLQKKFKDKGVVFVGISDETADKVKPFVTQQGAKMDYVVAIDDERKTGRSYMEAYGQDGIPTAFVVNKEGKVVWFGHPMAELEETIEQVLAGKFDLQAAIKKDEARAELDDYHRLSQEGDPKAKDLGKKILARAGDDAEALCDFAFAIVADIQNKHRDFALADEALNKAEKADATLKAQVLAIRAIGRFESGKQDEGITLIKQAIAAAKNDREKSRYESYLRVMERRKEAGAKKESQ